MLHSLTSKVEVNAEWKNMQRAYDSQLKKRLDKSKSFCIKQLNSVLNWLIVLRWAVLGYLLPHSVRFLCSRLSRSFSLASLFAQSMKIIRADTFYWWCLSLILILKSFSCFLMKDWLRGEKVLREISVEISKVFPSQSFKSLRCLPNISFINKSMKNVRKLPFSSAAMWGRRETGSNLEIASCRHFYWVLLIFCNQFISRVLRLCLAKRLKINCLELKYCVQFLRR